MMDEKYNVHLDNFDGPLDLLLHLIDKNKLDIYDIPIAMVTEQYMAYLNEAEQMDLEIASEFLLTAATLINIKAKMLLPKKILIAVEEADPREELVNRLLEHKFYKEMAGFLGENALRNSQYMVKEINLAQLSKDFTPVNPVANLSIDQLMVAFNNIILRIKEEPPVIELHKEEYDVEQLMGVILVRLVAQDSMLRFHELFEDTNSKRKVITMFLAVLELYKMHKIMVTQTENFAELWIYPL